MKGTLIIAASLALAAAAGAKEAAAPSRTTDATEARKVTATVKLAGVELGLADMVVTPKKAYVHVLWDAFPSRAQWEGPAKKADAALLAVADGLIEGGALAALSGAAHVKLDIVEFTRRDDYGAPDWSSVRKLKKLEYRAKDGALRRVPGKKP